MIFAIGTIAAALIVVSAIIAGSMKGEYFYE